MALSSVSDPPDFTFDSAFWLAECGRKMRKNWWNAAARLPGRLRPIEWMLLIVGAVALAAFVFVLWRQPVSHR